MSDIHEPNGICCDCRRLFTLPNRCPECVKIYRDTRAEGYKQDAAAWRESALTLKQLVTEAKAILEGEEDVSLVDWLKSAAKVL